LNQINISKVANLPTKYGEFFIQAFQDVKNHKEHLAIFSKDLQKIPLVRIHSECLTGDVFSSLKCDCGEQLHFALEKIYKEKGLILYLRQEGRDIGLLNKVNAYNLQDKGLNTVEANHQLGFESDLRKYQIADFILEYLQIKSIKLLTNNPKKLNELKKVKIIERVPIVINPNKYNKNYLNTKKFQMGHLL
jgi:GTP cyclohydrolase II